MPDNDDLFQPVSYDSDEAGRVVEAMRCIEAFTARFNARDLAGTDSCMHFPHIILSGERLVIWSEPGQLPAPFFEDLDRHIRCRALGYKAAFVLSVQR